MVESCCHPMALHEVLDAGGDPFVYFLLRASRYMDTVQLRDVDGNGL